MTTYKKAIKYISETDERKKNDVAVINETIQNARRSLNEAARVLEVTEDEEEYKKASETIASSKTTITLANRKLKTLETLISDEEYKELLTVIRSRYHELNEDKGNQINKALMDILSMLEEYEREVKELSSIESKTRELAGKTDYYTSPIKMNNLRIEDDEYKWFENFIRFYCSYRGKIYNLKKSGVIK